MSEKIVAMTFEEASRWIASQDARIAELEAAEQGAKEAFGVVVESKKELQAQLQRLQASFDTIRTLYSTAWARIRSLESALSPTADWLDAAIQCADWRWDPDQHAAAIETLADARASLAPAKSKGEGEEMNRGGEHG